jgi:hypothetical protein
LTSEITADSINRTRRSTHDVLRGVVPSQIAGDTVMWFCGSTIVGGVHVSVPKVGIMLRIVKKCAELD